MSPQQLRIGTRGSNLALAQTNLIVESVLTQVPSLEIEIVTVKTEGDQDRNTALTEMGGVGVFTKAIESALLEGRFDVAVHSAKDLPSAITPGLLIAAVPSRGACEDVLVSRDGKTLAELSAGAAIGTGSPRRRSQLLHLRPDLKVANIRGNVPTRLEKLSVGDYDALIMARAGMMRLGLEDQITEVLSPSHFLPAPGQGFLAVQARADDRGHLELLNTIDDAESHRCLDVERGLMAGLNAGCSAAVGGWARVEDDRLQLSAVVLDSIGTRRLAANGEIERDGDISGLVEQVTKQLISQGALELIGC